MKEAAHSNTVHTEEANKPFQMLTQKGRHPDPHHNNHFSMGSHVFLWL